MPQLPTYSAPLLNAPISGGRRSTAEDFGVGPTNVGHEINRAADKYLTSVEDDESRKALVASAELRAKYAKSLDEAAISGAELAPIKEQMQGDFAKVSENFQTRRGADSAQLHAANANLMFDEQANRINVVRASSTARLEASKFLQSASSIIQSNPLYLNVAQKDAEAFGATLTRLPPEKRAEIVDGLKKELNMSAALASSRIDPENTKKLLDGGAWDLTPEQRNVALNKADTEIRAKRADDRYQHELDKEAKRDKSEAASDQLFKGIIDGKTTRRAIMDNPDLTPEKREHLILMMEHRAKEMAGEERKSDPRVERDLWMRIHAPDGDPNKVYNSDAIFQAVQRGTITPTRADWLNNEVAGQKDENNRNIGSKLRSLSSNFERAVGQDPRMLQFDAQQKAQIMNDYVADVMTKVGDLRKANQNPSTVFDPKSKDYVGSREFMQQSIDAAAQRQRDALPKPVTVNTQAEYDALQPGTPYVDSSGNHGVKKGAAKTTGPEGSMTGPVTGTIRR